MSKHPTWLRFTPHIVNPPQLPAHEWKILGVVALISIFNRYDVTLLSTTLTQVQDSLDIAESHVGALVALVQLGAIPAVALTLAADRIGRRQVLLLTFLGYTLATGAAGVAPNTAIFVTLLFFARMAIVTGLLLAAVVITEEFGPDVRGWGVSALGAISVYGFGVALLLFALIDVLPGGWRFLYLASLSGLLIYRSVQRALPASSRFERQAIPARRVNPLVALFRMYPGRIAAVSTVTFLVGFGSQTALAFLPKYLQDVHRWSPGQVAAFSFLAGGLTLVASTQLGALSDHIGRKATAQFLLASYPVVIILLYNAAGLWLLMLWPIMQICAMGTTIVLGTYGAELFPTSHRSTSVGAQAAISNMGAVISLASQSALYQALHSHWVAISVLAVSLFVTPFLVWRTLPETSGRDLEDIAPELDLETTPIDVSGARRGGC